MSRYIKYQWENRPQNYVHVSTLKPGVVYKYQNPCTFCRPQLLPLYTGDRFQCGNIFTFPTTSWPNRHLFDRKKKNSKKQIPNLAITSNYALSLETSWRLFGWTGDGTLKVLIGLHYIFFSSLTLEPWRKWAGQNGAEKPWDEKVPRGRSMSAWGEVMSGVQLLTVYPTDCEVSRVRETYSGGLWEAEIRKGNPAPRLYSGSGCQWCDKLSPGGTRVALIDTFKKRWWTSMSQKISTNS